VDPAKAIAARDGRVSRSPGEEDLRLRDLLGELFLGSGARDLDVGKIAAQAVHLLLGDPPRFRGVEEPEKEVTHRFGAAP
jgi:hypothetical protein